MTVLVDRAAAARQRAAETKRRRTRAAILAAAGRLFEDQGGPATTMDQIAAEAGVSQAALYQHFPNKWQLAATALAVALEEVADPDADYLAGLDPAAAVDRFLTEVVRVDADHASYIRVTVGALAETTRKRSRAHDHEVRSIVPTGRALTELIRRGQVAGVFAPYPAPADAASMIVHAMVMRIAVRDEQAMPQTALLVRTLAARLLGYPAPSRG